MSDDPIDAPEDIARLAGIIQELGYKAQPINGHSIATALSGFSTVLFYFPEHSVQMYTGFMPNESVFGLEEANAFNEEYRFSKCYINNGIRLEGDFFFDINDEHAVDDLKLIFRSWEFTLGFASEAMRAAKELKEPEESGSAASNEGSEESLTR